MYQRRENLNLVKVVTKANRRKEHFQKDQEDWAGRAFAGRGNKGGYFRMNRFEPKQIGALFVFGK